MAEYCEHLVEYVDVLGFRHLISESADDIHMTTEIENQLELFIKWLAGFGLQGRFRAYNFSDHMVRVIRVEPVDDLVEHLNREGYYLAERQLQMAMGGWFIRGAICIGKLVATERIIFGPALVHA